MNLPHRFLYLLAVSALGMTIVQGAAPDARGWLAFYNTSGSESSAKLIQDARGNVYAGLGLSIVKYSPDGLLLWANTLDSDLPNESPAGDNFRSFAVDAQENLFVALARFAPEPGLALFKLDRDGHVLWQSRSRGFPAELGLDAAGNCFVAGTVNLGTSDLLDPRSSLAKFSPDGQRLWERVYGTSNYPYWGNAISMAVDSMGNAFVVGFTFTISKFDGNGVELWRKDYDGQHAYKVIVDAQGNSCITGTRLEADSLTVKLDSAGSELWKFIHSRHHSSSVTPTGIAHDSAGNTYLTTTSDVGNTDLIKLRPDGKIAWRNTEKGDGDFFFFNAVAVDAQGRSWLLFTSAQGRDSTEARLVHYDQDGRRLSRSSLDRRLPGSEYAGDLVLDRLGIPIVTIHGQLDGVAGWITAKLPPTRDKNPLWPHPRRD